MTARIVCKFFEIFNNKENYLLESKEPKDSNILLEKKKERDNSEIDIYNVIDKGEETNLQESKNIKNVINEKNNINTNQSETNTPKIEKNETNNKPQNEDDPIVLGINDINNIIDEF